MSQASSSFELLCLAWAEKRLHVCGLERQRNARVWEGKGTWLQCVGLGWSRSCRAAQHSLALSRGDVSQEPPDSMDEADQRQA